MRSIKNTITEYLKKPTDYAIQLTGDWGVGKTFYYKTELAQLIRATALPRDARKKYKPIYISLFGLKSIDDISTKIVLELFQSSYFNSYYRSTLGRKRLRITGNLFKLAIRGFLNFKRMGNLKDYGSEIKNIGQDVLDSKELMICFDDLERKDSSLHLTDLAGYINSLVDEGVKVLIIANESPLDNDDYKKIKDKIIGISLSYLPDSNRTLTEIIETRYAEFPTFQTYLKENFKPVERLSKSVMNNFRQIKYSLDNFQQIFSRIQLEILDMKDEISEKLREDLPSIFYVSLALSAEYKASNIKHDQLKYYKPKFALMDRLIRHTDPAGDLPVTGYERMFAIYGIDEADYFIFESIFVFITGAAEFDIKAFKNEYAKYRHLEKGNVLPEYECLEGLGYQNVLKLTDDEYKQRTLAMLQYAAEAKYKPEEYLSAMHFVERFDNVLDLDLTETSEKLKAAVTKVIEGMEEPLQVGFDAAGSRTDSAYVQAIHSAGMRAFRLAKSKRVDGQLHNIITLFTESLALFEERYSKESEFKEEALHHDFINELPVPSFLIMLANAPTADIHFLRAFFYDRYANNGKLRAEAAGFSRIYTAFVTYYQQAGTAKTLRTAVLKELHNTLEKFYIVLNPRRPIATMGE